MKHLVKPAASLFITAVLTVAALSVVYNLTLEPIENQKHRMRDAAMREVFPQGSEFREIQTEKTGSITAVYEALNNNVLTGYVVQLSPEGYSGAIDLMVGVLLPDEVITGMRILQHTETPGLGALAVREDFYRQYNRRPLTPLGVVKTAPGQNEIQAITSATITTRAITNAVNEAMEWYFLFRGTGR